MEIHEKSWASVGNKTLLKGETQLDSDENTGQLRFHEIKFHVVPLNIAHLAYLHLRPRGKLPLCLIFNFHLQHRL